MKKYAILYKIKIKHWLVLKSFARLNYIPFFFIFSHLCIIIEYSIWRVRREEGGEGGGGGKK